MNWNTRWGRRACKVISAWVWAGALRTGGKTTDGFGLEDWNVKKKVSLHSRTLHPLYVAFLENYPPAFQILLQLLYVYPFKMMDTKLGGRWSLLRWCKILTLPCKASKNFKKIGFLGPFQGKMQVLQVPLGRKNSHLSYGVNLVQEHSKKATKVTAV